jgi:hypothetical protein
LKKLSPRQHSALGEHLAIVEDDAFEETVPKASEFKLLFKQTNGLVKRLLEQFEKPEGTPNAKSATIRKYLCQPSAAIKTSGYTIERD